MTKTQVVWHAHHVTKQDRQLIKGHAPAVLWITGLSGSGKSTIANALECRLHQLGVHTYVLDGDNIRHGLNNDLGFSSTDRKENIRRIGEVARLFIDAGVVTIGAFISPFREDREFARSLVQTGEFIEIYTKCSLAECQRRDPKGFYKMAINGDIQNFTGISHPYEEPTAPELILETEHLSVDACVDRITQLLYERGIIKQPITSGEKHA